MRQHVLRCLNVSVILNLSDVRGIFLPCRSSRGKIPDYEFWKRIQFVFGDIFICYIYFLSQAISALNNDNVKQNGSEKNVKRTATNIVTAIDDI